MLIRSWNLFHGNTSPRGPRVHLREMIELATADRPDAVCLQELPLWSLGRLEEWSGMSALSAVAKRTLVPRRLGGVLQRRDPRRFRSAVTGQANAILLAPGHVPLEHRTVRVSAASRERRVCHAVRLEGIVIGNVHASNQFRRPDVPRAELKRAHALVEELARPGDARVLAGDFNLDEPELPGPNIDHIVVAGVPHGPLEVWPEERRRQNGAVLSDHAPVEVRVG
ncbi:MAG TPA: endonuclease/exonuclease/phosphatase family protein [Gaiellaceae bacterium]|nr:endonuclease/exonuclease/phosphatase family protein [Gaiellaceae bacterium]